MKHRVLRSLDEVKQVPLCVCEEQHTAAAARGLGLLGKHYAAARQFRLCRLDGLHAQREVPPACHAEE